MRYLVEVLTVADIVVGIVVICLKRELIRVLTLLLHLDLCCLSLELLDRATFAHPLFMLIPMA